MVFIYFLGDNLAPDAVKKLFFRKLVTTDFLESFSQPSRHYACTNLFLFVYATRDSGLEWFYPNTRFRVPKRGALYSIEMANPALSVDTSLIVSSSGSNTLDMSGVSPLEWSRSELSTPRCASHSELCSPSCKRSRFSESFEEVCDVDEYIWYQAPVSFLGFK